jgi:hypothetical protein
MREALDHRLRLDLGDPCDPKRWKALPLVRGGNVRPYGYENRGRIGRVSDRERRSGAWEELGGLRSPGARHHEGMKPIDLAMRALRAHRTFVSPGDLPILRELDLSAPIWVMDHLPVDRRRGTAPLRPSGGGATELQEARQGSSDRLGTVEGEADRPDTAPDGRDGYAGHRRPLDGRLEPGFRLLVLGISDTADGPGAAIEKGRRLVECVNQERGRGGDTLPLGDQQAAGRLWIRKELISRRNSLLGESLAAEGE